MCGPASLTATFPSSRGGNGSEPFPIGVDVIVRFHDCSRLAELDRALFSLACQSSSPVRPIIVTQHFTVDQTRAVRVVLDRYPWCEQGSEPAIVNVEGPPGADLRSKLINAGFAQARHRFVAILDYDDCMLERAYEDLTSEALRSGAAIAFGRIMVKYVRVIDDSVYTVRTLPDMYRGLGLEDLLADNFCPIHSFLIDRARVDHADLRFDETMTRLEDYEFLLRFCTKYACSFGSVSKLVGIYNWRTEGGNSIQVFERDEEKIRANAVQWERARHRIEELKRSLRPHSGISERR